MLSAEAPYIGIGFWENFCIQFMHENVLNVCCTGVNSETTLAARLAFTVQLTNKTFKGTSLFFPDRSAQASPCLCSTHIYSSTCCRSTPTTDLLSQSLGWTFYVSVLATKHPLNNYVWHHLIPTRLWHLWKTLSGQDGIGQSICFEPHCSSMVSHSHRFHISVSCPQLQAVVAHLHLRHLPQLEDLPTP